MVWPSLSSAPPPWPSRSDPNSSKAHSCVQEGRSHDPSGSELREDDYLHISAPMHYGILMEVAMGSELAGLV